MSLWEVIGAVFSSCLCCCVSLGALFSHLCNESNTCTASEVFDVMQVKSAVLSKVVTVQ